MSNITVTDFNGNVLYHGDDKGYFKQPDNAEVCNWIITIKGYISQSFRDDVLRKKYIGTRYEYGKMFFRGTEKQLADFEMDIFKDGIKIIGSKKEGEGQFITRNQAMILYRKAVEKEFRILVEDNEQYTPRVMAQKKVTVRVQSWYMAK